MSDFESLGLSAKTLRAVDAMGYDEPTPVQEQTIPLVLRGHDVIAGAQTGTGKTAAFCLPVLDKLPRAQKGCGPLMLVVTPTRELADQIGEVCNQISKETYHKITTVVGGVSYNPQIQKLKKGTDVLIATPGRLEDLMGQNAVSLDQVKVLVLDEADRMLDMGFLPAVTRIVKACTAEHQTLMFSATIDERVEKAAAEMLHEPNRVEIARRGETADTVDQYIVNIAHAAKPSALLAVFEERGAERVIVFTRTRYRAASCARRLKRMGYSTEAIHSDRSQSQRRTALANFEKGKVQVLVATDVLARGIDIDKVNYVVNFDLPNQPEDYVHRIGRTGRAGERGLSISFVSPENEEALKNIEELIKKKIPVMEISDFDREAAEAAAADRSMQLQARRSKDPEIEAAAKELADKKRKERKKKAKALAEAEEKASKGKSGKPKASKREDAEGKKPEKAAASNKPSNASKDSKKNKAVSGKKTPNVKAGKGTIGKLSSAKQGAKGPNAPKSKKKNIATAQSAKPTKAANAQKGKKSQSNKEPQKAQWVINAEKRKKAMAKKSQNDSGKKSRRGSSRDMRPGRSHRAAQAQRRARF